MPLFNIILTKESNDSALPNDCCPFEFGAVMGQEDLYREDPPGDRVDNALTARIVWATSVPGTSRVIWDYASEVGFANDTGVVATEKTFHEVFFPLPAVNTTYKFQIITTSSVCDPGGETLQSGTYYFETGGELNVGEYTIVISIDNDIVTIVPNDLEIEDGIDAFYDDSGTTSEVLSAIQTGISAEVDIVPTDIQSDIDATYIYTDYSTSVS